jgi:hypothetical protein
LRTADDFKIRYITQYTKDIVLEPTIHHRSRINRVPELLQKPKAKKTLRNFFRQQRWLAVPDIVSICWNTIQLLIGSQAKAGSVMFLQHLNRSRDLKIHRHRQFSVFNDWMVFDYSLGGRLVLLSYAS